ncbi:protein PARTING DANCERS homolog isoform X1 [Elaeis guineensis]|uniref:Protein PARTING DANCERS isoform X1 n=1 Tax=Elaeis guineensis var. tenera TaxID=51953 RepID=A0A8N4IC95_ELAGV|nr:protein PARTING DANCERS isoform X1 [Elaeis guineensis]
MASVRGSWTDRARNPPIPPNSGSGVCMMNTSWRDNQHPSFILFISSFLSANSYRLNFLPIAADFIFNNGGLSVAFIFVTNWDCDNGSAVFDRAEKLKRQFRHLYVVVSVPTREQNDSFNHSYFKYAVELGSPTFVPVHDPEMGFEKIVKIAHAHGGRMLISISNLRCSSLNDTYHANHSSAVCKRQDAISMMKNEREQAVQGMDLFLRVVTSIPGIDNHDANALAQAIGSIEAISKASKGFILENTDLSVDKAERIVNSLFSVSKDEHHRFGVLFAVPANHDYFFDLANFIR